MTLRTKEPDVYMNYKVVFVLYSTNTNILYPASLAPDTSGGPYAMLCYALLLPYFQNKLLFFFLSLCLFFIIILWGPIYKSVILVAAPFSFLTHTVILHGSLIMMAYIRRRHNHMAIGIIYFNYPLHSTTHISTQKCDHFVLVSVPYTPISMYIDIGSYIILEP